MAIVYPIHPKQAILGVIAVYPLLDIRYEGGFEANKIVEMFDFAVVCRLLQIVERNNGRQWHGLRQFRKRPIINIISKKTAISHQQVYR